MTEHSEREIANLKRKVENYTQIVSNSRTYREAWNNELQARIVKCLTAYCASAGLDVKIETIDEVENLGAVTLSLGQVKSGIFEEVNETIKRHLIKQNGSLIYQQLFNGKIIVMIQYPHIENLGQPRPPKNIGIYRPEEIKDPFLLRHLEEFITEVTYWEDFDDDEPNQQHQQRIGFDLNFPQGEIEQG